MPRIIDFGREIIPVFLNGRACTRVHSKTPPRRMPGYNRHGSGVRRSPPPPRRYHGRGFHAGRGRYHAPRHHHEIARTSRPPPRYHRPTHGARATRDVATWCHIGGGAEASYTSSSSWDTQPRPARGALPAPAPFTGRSRDDLRRIDPLRPLPEEAFVQWCALCAQCVVSESAHESSETHRERLRLQATLQQALAPGPQQEATRRLLQELAAALQGPGDARMGQQIPLQPRENALQGEDLIDMEDEV